MTDALVVVVIVILVGEDLLLIFCLTKTDTRHLLHSMPNRFNLLNNSLSVFIKSLCFMTFV